MKITKTDIDFILSQLTLPGNNPLNAPNGTIIDPTGIRDVRGIGNNVLNPTWGAADHLFPRLTNVDTSPSPVYLYSSNFSGTTPGSYAVRGTNLVDANPRLISNLVSDQSDLQPIDVQDNPSNPAGARLSPLTGTINPLPFSSYMTFFGQFFDHGLDFVHKGVDGAVFIPLLPGDPLYVEGSQTNFMVASRTNTVNVTIGQGSTNTLASELGLTDNGVPHFTAVTGAHFTGPSATASSAGGTLDINGAMIGIAAGSTAQNVVDAINAQTLTTNVIASLDGGGNLVLTPSVNQSVNTVSPYIDLSQAYGSSPSHSAFLKEYVVNVNTNVTSETGQLVSEANGSMPTWATIVANAAKIGITLHDYNVTDIPLLRTNADGSIYYDANGHAFLVAQDLTTGLIAFVSNTDKDTLSTSNLTLVTIGHAFLDDMAHPVSAALSSLDTHGDIIDTAANLLLDAHIIAGDGRANENIALTSIHEVFHAEHNRVLQDIRIQVLGLGTDSTGAVYNTPRADAASWTPEMFFQAAKLVTEMEYQHLVFGEFARKLSPNINAFAGYTLNIDPAITAEFAHAVYRFGHSMLTETVAMQSFNVSTGIATTDASSTNVITGSGIHTVANSNLVTIDISQSALVAGDHITISKVSASIGGLTAADLNGTFIITAVNTGHITIQVNSNASGTESGLSGDSDINVSLNQDSGLIDAFLNPLLFNHTVAGEVAIGSSQQVGNAIDEWVTGALRNNLVGLPLDLATLNIVRARDALVPSLNEVRLSLFNSTGMSSLTPYANWDEFGQNLLHPDSLVNFIAAYARDTILTSYTNTIGTHTNHLTAAFWNDISAGLATNVAAKAAYILANDLSSKAYWDDLQLHNAAAYGQALTDAANAALNDPLFMTDTVATDAAVIALNSIDLWLGGLAEAKSGRRHVGLHI